MRKTLIGLLLFPLTIVTAVKAQDYHPPLNIPLVLSGNFGEIRSNHFHSGIDIKTQGRTGLPVLSIEKGTVVRVKVSPYGYGKALYINHPDGKTSVYGHLDSFHPEIEKWITDQQYAQKTYDINAFPPAGLFTFEKGEEIGKSGNSGSSGGPHLHFEIRDTKTEEALNPLTYPFKISDTRPPSVYGLSVYALDPFSHVNQKDYANFSMGGSYGNYTLKAGESITANGNIGIAIHSIDRLNAAENKCGVYKITNVVNGDTIFQMKIDRVNFNTNRYMNAHIDYNLFKKYRKHYHRLFKVENNALEIYPSTINDGVISCDKDQKLEVKIYVEDVAGNTSTITFDINSKSEKFTRILEGHPNLKRVDALKPFEWKSEIASVSIPPKTLYFSDEIMFSSELDANGIPVLEVGDKYTGAQNSFTLQLKVPDSFAAFQDKIYLGKVAANGRAYADNAGFVSNGWFTAKNREFGTYTLLVDSVNPNIKPLYFYNGKEVRNGNKIRFRISDSGSGVQDYKMTIDGNWALAAYDYRTGAVTHIFNAERIKPGNHVLRLELTDKVGNTESYEANFTSY